MYHVARGRWALPVLAGLAAALALLVGAGGRALAAQAAGGRQLPIYSVETPERLVALGINCAWDDSGLGELLALLEERGLRSDRVAVERNGAIVPRAEFAATVLEAGDRLEIVRFVGGG